SGARVRARAGAEGALRVAGAAAGGNRRVVEAKGCGAAHLVNVRGGAMAKPITVGPGIALTGTVVRGDRKTPAVGALVRFEADGVATRGVPTAGDGGFKLVDLPPRAGRVIVDGGEAGPGAAPAGGPIGPPGRPLTIVLAPPSTLAGTVMDAATRQGVARARITLEEDQGARLARAGPDGRYEVRGLAPQRPYRMTVDDPRFAPFERR